MNASIAFASTLTASIRRTIEHLVLAEMRMLSGRFDEALAGYDTHLAGAETGGKLAEVTVATADRARCLLHLGRDAEAAAEIARALDRLDSATPAEVRAIVHDNAAEIALASGRARDARQHAQLAQIAWAASAHEQREASRLLHDGTT